jgi:Ca2+-transporting ATPase
VGSVVSAPVALTGEDGPSGITSVEAQRRLAADGPNELPISRERRLLQQGWDVVRQPILLLLIAAGTVNFLLSEPLDGFIMMTFVVVVVAISIYQEHKTEHALAALRDLSSPRALVIRDGQQRRVAGREVVRGDVVLLNEGDRVPADAVLVDAVNMSVDESALTGESVPVRKVPAVGAVAVTVGGRPGGDATSAVFSGTLVVKGHGVALVLETGDATELGRIGVALRSIEPERTTMQREIDRLVAIVAAG